MLYFANPTTVAEPAMRRGLVAYIDTPRQGNVRPDGLTWCADNGCFSEAFDKAEWWGWLVANADSASSCVFATAPDVVGDAAATLQRSRPWLARIRALGYRVAFVAQDGIEATEVPWDEFDVLFIGGSDNFKIGGKGNIRLDGTSRGPVPSAAIIAEARARGKWVHVGRVNSRCRFRYFSELGVDSADGTCLTKAPRQNIHRLLSWVHEDRGEHVVAKAHVEAAKREAARAKAAKIAATAAAPAVAA